MDTSRIGNPSPQVHSANPAIPAAAAARTADAGSPASAPPIDTVSKTASDPTAKTEKKWTFLFYINGNNFLAKQAPAQLRMLEMTGGSDENINIVAQVARKKSGLDRITRDWSGVRRYEVPATGKELNQSEMASEILRQLVPPHTRGITSTLKEDLGQADMGDPETLKSFLEWGMNEYPAEHYCVVMMGPSQGMNGVMADVTSGNDINLEELKGAIEGASAASGKTVDVLAFDSSNSTQAEMLYALKDSAKFVVGSEGLVSGTGMSTPSIMFELKKSNTDKTRTPEEVAQTFSMVGSMGVSQAGFTPTVAAVDMSKIGGLREAFDELGDALLKSDIDRAHLRELVQGTQEVAMPGVTRAYAGVKDAYHFAKQLVTDETIHDAAVKAAAEKIMTQVDGALVGEAHRGGPYRNANGISVFMPDNYGFIRPDSFPFDKDFDHKFNYESLGFAKDSAWPKFLSEIAQDDFAGRVGSKILGRSGLDKIVGAKAQATPLVQSLGGFASSVGWWESYNTLSTGRPSRYLFIPPQAAAAIGTVGGVYDAVRGVASGVQAFKAQRSYDAIVMNGLDALGGVAKTVACASLINPGAVPLAVAAGTFGFIKPWLKDAYGYFMQYKAIRDSIALNDPAAGQKAAVMAVHAMINKDKVWDK